MEILEKTALPQGHFVYPNGKQLSIFSDAARVRYMKRARSSVGLRRMFEWKIYCEQLANSIISPSPGGIMVAFGVREALSANRLGVKSRRQRSFVSISRRRVYPAIIVAIFCVGLKRCRNFRSRPNLGAEIIGCGTIVNFEDAQRVKRRSEKRSLMTLILRDGNRWKYARSAFGMEQKVRF